MICSAENATSLFSPGTEWKREWSSVFSFTLPPFAFSPETRFFWTAQIASIIYSPGDLRKEEGKKKKKHTPLTAIAFVIFVAEGGAGFIHVL